MEISQGCINSMYLLQKMIYPPTRVVISSSQVKEIVSPDFFRKKSRARKIWKINKRLMCCIAMLSYFQIISLFRQWKKGNNAQHLCVNTLVLSLMIVQVVASDTLSKSAEELSYLATHSKILAGFRSAGYPSLKRIPNWKDLMVIYEVSGVFITFTTLVPSALPLFIYHHPLKIVTKFLLDLAFKLGFQHAYLEIILDTVSGAIYGVVGFHGGGCFLFLLLGSTVFTETLVKASFQLFDKRKLSKFSVQKIFHINVIVSRTSYGQVYKIYRCMQILIRVANQAVSQYFQTLMVIGILGSACSGYTCIKLYSELPFTIYILVTIYLPLCVLLDIVLFILAAIPYENTFKFKSYWTRELRGKFDRTQIRSCPLLCYSFGFVEQCRRTSALSVLDLIINGVASLTLLRPTYLLT